MARRLRTSDGIDFFSRAIQMTTPTRSIRRYALTLLSIGALGACGDSTGVEGPGSVSLNFRVPAGERPAATIDGPARAPARVAGGPMTVVGTNGELVIDEIRLIVSEVELGGDDDRCEDSGHDGPDDSGGTSTSSDCAKFEAPPRFLDLPLDGQAVEAFVGLVPPGTYDELDFQIEDLEDDENDSRFYAEIAELRQRILGEFPDWPRKATALVAGTFVSTGGETVGFRAYIEAEIEIERDLVPPLVVGDDGSPGTDLTVDVRPDLWFSRPDGTVLDLSAFDYGTSGRVLELELEMEDGFTEIEVDDNR